LARPSGTSFAIRSVIVAHPRRIVSGAIYLVTRRCYQRTFRLRPSPQTNAIFAYCLALALLKTGVRLHAACVMSNHHHLVVSDPSGRLSDFLRELHRLSAKAINASQGQWENLWSAEPCNAVRLVTDEDVRDKIAYVVANPVAAGLVSEPGEWPGFSMWGDRSVRAVRPQVYFGEDSSCPADIPLQVELPPTYTEQGDSRVQWFARARSAIAAKVAAAHQAMQAAGRAFLGANVVRSASFAQRAKSYEVKGKIIPTFAAGVRAVRDRLRKIERAFRGAYRVAYADWRSGLRETVFPFGTWGMAVFHGARVEAVGPE
jgi:putative transposase